MKNFIDKLPNCINMAYFLTSDCAYLVAKIFETFFDHLKILQIPNLDEFTFVSRVLFYCLERVECAIPTVKTWLETQVLSVLLKQRTFDYNFTRLLP